MKSRDRVRIFLISGAVLLSIVFLIGGTVLSQNSTKASKRSDFPVLEPSPFLLAREVSFEDQVEASDLIVEATVENVHPVEIRELIPEKGSPEAFALEKSGGTSIVYAVLTVEMKAEDYIKGNADEIFEVTIAGFSVDSAPDFKVGERYLLTLHEYTDGSYTNVTPVSSYFFISDDDKVYPAGNDAPTLKYSGMGLSAAKQDMQFVSETVELAKSKR